MSAEKALLDAKNRIYKDIKFEMDRQGYSNVSLADLLNIRKSLVSYAIRGGTTPRDVKIRKKIYRILGME
ncbi:transcriptional regulator [Lactobacillus sp. ESL0230]|uniref:transcriptional regulator n=1 Tax=Lactobacillus sp. ESL0230 TaxID=2069353 RepID=UPI000EFA73CC|nr:transcriptional regulator [Lactobacillus sp. ESL0230]RMC46547.1 transcriptional regulator [Lactobacillus sp. ESL0230]